MNLPLWQGSGSKGMLVLRAANFLWFWVETRARGRVLPVLELVEAAVERTPDAGDLLPPLPVQQLLGQHVAHQHVDLVNHAPYFAEHLLSNGKGVAHRPQGTAMRFGD